MATAEETAFNKKVNAVKLILSSLFARKQDYLVVDGNIRNKLLFTNISPDRAIFYKPDIEDTLHEVKLSEAAASNFYDIFPIFRSTICVVQLSKLLSRMNKRLTVLKGRPIDLRVDTATGSIVIDCPPDKAEVNKAMFDGNESQELMTVPVGHLITEDLFVKYEEIIARHMSFIKEPIERTVSVSSAVGDDKFVLNNIELDNVTYNCPVLVNIPIADGISVVSYKEYLSKKKLPWKYKALIMYNPKRSVAKIAYEHRDDMVDALCISPGTLWFPYRKK